MSSQSSNFENPNNANNFDVRCGELITVKVNKNVWEMMYCEQYGIDDLCYPSYKPQCPDSEERIWGIINQRVAPLFEKCDWADKCERDQEILDTIHEVLDEYNVEHITYGSQSSDDE